MGAATPQGPGWWCASDGKWYPPESHPGAPLVAPALPAPAAFPGPASSLPAQAAAQTMYAAPTWQQPPPTQWSATITASPHADPSAASTATSTVANILWLVLAGFWLAIGYVFAGLVNMVTIIGIPFGIQAFKLAGYALWPFGRVVVQRPGRDAGLSTLGNVVWFLFGGFFLAMAHLLAGLLLCLTIIGIPLGLASIKMAGLAIAPFGKQVISRSQLASMPGVVIVSQV